MLGGDDLLGGDDMLGDDDDLFGGDDDDLFGGDDDDLFGGDDDVTVETLEEPAPQAEDLMVPMEMEEWARAGGW